MKKIVLISLIVVAVIFGITKYRSRHAAPPANAIWVQASTVAETNLPIEINTIGSLTARSVEVTPEMPGHVEKILFKDGAFVKQGERLIQLDDAVYKAKHQSAAARLVYSENDYKRKAQLGKQGVVTQQAIDQADADLKERQAEAKETEVMLNKMQLIAPFDGMLGKCKISPGDYVTIGQSLVTLTDRKHLRIEYNVPEKYLPSLKHGQMVKVTSSAYPGQSFTGEVVFISPTINTENRSISLYAEINNDNDLLAPGMFVNVNQSLGTEKKVLMIPARSLVPILDGEQVFKIVDGKAYSVSVTIGRRLNENVQILHGLSLGDKVITDGQLKLQNGLPVQVKS